MQSGGGCCSSVLRLDFLRGKEQLRRGWAALDPYFGIQARVAVASFSLFRGGEELGAIVRSSRCKESRTKASALSCWGSAVMVCGERHEDGAQGGISSFCSSVF